MSQRVTVLAMLEEAPKHCSAETWLQSVTLKLDRKYSELSFVPNNTGAGKIL